MKLVRKLCAFSNLFLFFTKETLKSRKIKPRKKLSFLFPPHPEWEKKIRFGFLLTPHSVTFADFTPDNVGNYDVVVPIDLGDAKRLFKYRKYSPQNPLATQAPVVVELCDDKFRFNEHLLNSEWGHLIPPMNQRFDFPYILKKKVDAWGRNTFLINNEDDETRHVKEIEDPDFFTQKIILGTNEYATHIIIQKGEIHCSMNIEYTFNEQSPIKGKSSLLYKKVCDCPYLEEFTALLNHIGYEGLCCINYKVYNGIPYLIEINPRFGGSLAPFFFSFGNYFAAKPPVLTNQ